MGRPRGSELVTIISFIYEMNEEDQQQIEDEILRTRAAAWQAAVQAEARRLGYQGTVNPPRGRDLEQLRRQSREDAISIRRTHNKAVRNQVQRLYDQNPRGNRNYYAKNMETWYVDRDDYKARQIALNTEQTGFFNGKETFIEVNGLEGGTYVYDGASPVGPICKERFAKGRANWRYVRNNPTPAHPNCPHSWLEVEPPRLASGTSLDELWVG